MSDPRVSRPGLHHANAMKGMISPGPSFPLDRVQRGSVADRVPDIERLDFVVVSQNRDSHERRKIFLAPPLVPSEHGNEPFRSCGTPKSEQVITADLPGIRRPAGQKVFNDVPRPSSSEMTVSFIPGTFSKSTHRGFKSAIMSMAGMTRRLRSSTGGRRPTAISTMASRRRLSTCPGMEASRTLGRPRAKAVPAAGHDLAAKIPDVSFEQIGAGMVRSIEAAAVRAQLAGHDDFDPGCFDSQLADPS